MTIEKLKAGMTMGYPATRWQDALPTGSGVVGALMYGQIRNDIIVLNHNMLYYPKEQTAPVDVSDQLPEMRRLISLGQYQAAAALMPGAFAERAKKDSGDTSALNDPYQPFCSVALHTETHSAFRDYQRGVDFTTGRVWTEWVDHAAATTRELFVSRVSDTVFLRIRGSLPGTLNYHISLATPRNEQHNLKTWAGSGEGDVSVQQAAALDHHTLSFAARYPNGFTFGAIARVEIVRGQVSPEGNGLVIRGADEIAMRIKLYIGEEPAAATPRLIKALQDKNEDFDTALAEHAAVHGQLFNRVTMELNSDERQPAKKLSNEEMLIRAYGGNVPGALVQTMFEFGRYLLVCSSRPGSWPANLQGLWNGDTSPAWNSDFHTDENIQMNYWQALPGRLPEAALSMFDYFENFIDDYRENARMIFGCRGILMPIAQTTHGHEYPRIWSNWTAAAGWIGQHFYDYYLFTGDLDFLRNRAVPWLKEVALFYEDFLTVGEDGRLLFSPSLSPENQPANSDSLLTMNATMDIAVCREVLQNLCHACQLLGIEPERIEHWQRMASKLPAYEVNADGALREWLHPAFDDNDHHRHQSHLYPLFPGLEITEETHPDLYQACRIAVEKRLVIGLASQSGWSMAHMANIYARLGMGNRALECVEILVRSSTGPNLFTYHNDWRDMGLSLTGRSHPPFQIDANFGITAAVMEMLVFSKPGMLKLLPALPDPWVTGRVTGLACRGGMTVDITWNREKSAFSATLLSTSSQYLLLKLPWDRDAVQFSPEAMAAPPEACGAGYRNIRLQKGIPLHITLEGE